MLTQNLNELGLSGLFEETNRSLFYRKALGLRRYYENCKIPTYNGEFLYPSGEVATPHFMSDLAAEPSVIAEQDKDLAQRIENDFCKYRSSVPSEHTMAGNMYTHSMPNYERILKEGLLSYLPRINKATDVDFKEGLNHLVCGIQTYVNRCTEYLESVNADQKLINALKKVPLYPAENIYEAIVGWNFILYLDGCDNLGCVASGLMPYYNGEDVTALLRNLYDNLDVNVGWSMALGTDYSPLTVQCLEAAKGKRRPMIELFVDDTTPDEVWDKAFELIRTSGGQPAFYNPSVLLKGLQDKFNISNQDIKNFCGGGCTESMIAGYSSVGSLDAGIHLPLILENCIKTELATAKDFNDFYCKYISAVNNAVDVVTTQISHSQEQRALYNPLPMRTLLVDDCIDKGLDYNNCGARYRWSIINFAGIINVIDSMLVIRDLVFGDKTYSANEFISRLAANDTQFIATLRNHNMHFGNDIPFANEFSNKLSTDIFSMLDNKKSYAGHGFLPSSIQFMSQVYAGEMVGATPDGREAYTPLCDSLAAVFGKDTKGPTALLKSVTSLDLKRALGVPVLNFNINPDFKNETLKALILGYMQLGGIQMQITCISKEILQAAYKNPDMYKNLVVRVGGYSEYFYKLPDEVKRMIIERTIHSEV